MNFLGCAIKNILFKLNLIILLSLYVDKSKLIYVYLHVSICKPLLNFAEKHLYDDIMIEGKCQDNLLYITLFCLGTFFHFLFFLYYTLTVVSS